jgi:hypothetical protein
VSGGNLAEVAPTSTAGRTFRRFLAQNVPEQAIVRIDVPFAITDARTRYFTAVAVVCGIAMIGAITVAARRRRPALAHGSAAAPSESEQLLQAIATLDARFERANNGSADDRSRYDAERAALKTRLAAVLAEGRQSR